MAESFYYGGQALIEGVMMRGQRHMAMAVRRPDGEILLHSEPLKGLYTSRLARAPFLRGVLLLWETLILGTRALLFSASISHAEEEEIPPSMVWGIVILGLAFAIALFFLAPLFLTQWLDPYLGSALWSNLVEGALRLGLLLGYIIAIGYLPDIRRVFAYHGAEHMTINAYEEGAPLEMEAVKAFHTAHPRCGTAFLLIVVLLSILVFALLGQPPMAWRILSRVLLIPVLASLGYELMRLGAAHQKRPLLSILLTPSLALQALTTRQPEDGQLEVAIAALKRVLEEDHSEAACPMAKRPP